MFPLSCVFAICLCLKGAASLGVTSLDQASLGVHDGVEGKKPNIVLIVADDFGYNDIGYHGSEIQTPALDRLAKSGVKLENYYVQPTCSPTRSQLLSGRYQIHTGLQHGVIRPTQANGLPLENPTIADKLKEAGYSTHMVGKWHLGFYKNEYLPTSRGFDSFYGYLLGAEDYYTHHRCYGAICGFDLRDNLDPVTNANGTYSTHLFTERVVGIIDKHDDQKPLFLYVPFQSVHAPLHVPDKYTEPYRDITDAIRRTYAGMVSCMDEAVHNITMALKQRGLWDNSILIFTTDNGGHVEHGGNNWPLRGWKGSLWEGGMHAVGFVSGPLLDQSVRGTISRGLIHVSDWFPTFIRLASGNLNGTMPLDGFDQWNTINGSPSPRTELLHNIDPLFGKSGLPRINSTFDTRTRAALRSGDWKIITGHPGTGSWIPPPTMTSGNHVIHLSKSESPGKNVWLFNITADPTERYDLSEQYPNVVDSLLAKLKAYEDTAVPCQYPALDERADPKLLGGFWGPWE